MTVPEYPTFDFDQIDFVTSDTHFSHARISELTERPSALSPRWMLS